MVIFGSRKDYPISSVDLLLKFPDRRRFLKRHVLAKSRQILDFGNLNLCHAPEVLLHKLQKNAVVGKVGVRTDDCNKFHYLAASFSALANAASSNLTS